MNALFEGKRKPKVSLEILGKKNVSCIRQKAEELSRALPPPKRPVHLQNAAAGSSGRARGGAQAGTGRRVGRRAWQAVPGVPARLELSEPLQRLRRSENRRHPGGRVLCSPVTQVDVWGRLQLAAPHPRRPQGPPAPAPTLEGDARVVDQHVEAPVLLEQEVAQGADALQVVDVQLVEARAQALGLQLLHGRPAPRRVPRREHHVPGELPAQFPCDGEADALVGSGHQRHAAAGRHGRVGNAAGPRTDSRPVVDTE
uniref:Uncharacterized protein n=1 Tax=Rhinolophus ferrumequinum TaxID=59479 RepID=A0A671DR29_RHIFE